MKILGLRRKSPDRLVVVVHCSRRDPIQEIELFETLRLVPRLLLRLKRMRLPYYVGLPGDALLEEAEISEGLFLRRRKQQEERTRKEDLRPAHPRAQVLRLVPLKRRLP